MTGDEIIKWIKNNGLERINMFRPGRKLIVMNAKQSLRAVSKQLEEQEALIAEQARLLNLYKADVKNFYACIEGTVDGKSICDWCDAFEECQLQDKGGKGCKEWEHILQQQEEGKDES